MVILPQTIYVGFARPRWEPFGPEVARSSRKSSRGIQMRHLRSRPRPAATELRDRALQDVNKCAVFGSAACSALHSVASGASEPASARSCSRSPTCLAGNTDRADILPISADRRVSIATAHPKGADFWACAVRPDIACQPRAFRHRALERRQLGERLCPEVRRRHRSESFGISAPRPQRRSRGRRNPLSALY